ncbi:PPE family protein [Mycobacterium rhizamassiliense]|uniref:PPE family protein n=1 Tax=Mycobacterium rhizamassiliense TaxID=1841860 RepID=A0A2U3P1A2_9MYCO|nr:PPE family protein [Mycobacterium rhizamassiliense]SPM37542.1 PPE family protein [Mycobacterium rhizamassiliense]
MNFAALPPEVTSGRLHQGPGCTTLLESVTAWEQLTIRLSTAAADYRAVTSKLAARAAVATAVTDAAALFVDWLSSAAGHAQQAAAHAGAAAHAYETALAASATPAAVAGNRALRTALVATNCLGQHGPAIAAAESDYERMWAQNVDAMYAYAGACADASTIAPFSSPPSAAAREPRSWVLQSAPELVAAGQQVMDAIPQALHGISHSPPTTFDAALAPVTPSLSKLSSLTAPSGLAIAHLNSLNKSAALRWLLPNQGGATSPVITARLGRAGSTGMLSVPPAWSTGAGLALAGAAVRAV